MLQLKTFLLICVISGVSCEILFPSYDNFFGNNSSDDILCPEFDKINNGKIVIQKLSATRRVATITCDHGYDIEGNNNIYCIDGQWEYNSLPQCIKRCLPPPYLKDGALEIEGEKDEDGYYPKGTVASYSCSEGYELTPETSVLRVCEKGIWTGPVASCVPNFIQVAGSCSRPKPIENGYYVQEKSGELEEYNNFGKRLQYSCNNGYYLIGPRLRICLDDGTWSPKVQPMCIPRNENPGDIPCNSLPTVSNSNIEVIQQSDRRSTSGAIVEIRCLGKYRNSLSPCETTRLKCQGGKWVGVLPRCLAAHDCFPPPPVPYATIVDVNYNLYDTNNPTNFPIKSTVTYQCLEGFFMQGEPVMSCTVGGCWTPPDPPMCVRERPPSVRKPTDFIAEVDNINAILMSAAAGAGVLGILLLICLMVACKRKKQHSTTVAIPQPMPRSELEDHTALLEHPDRLALIASADGVQRNQLNLLPSYDEAIRSERGASLSASRPHRPHWPNLAGRRTRNSPNPDVGHVTRHGSFASHTPSTRSAGDSMGSTDTMAVSEGSTNVTLDTASSHSGSQPASCRAHCGSLASFDACSVVNTEDVPLLEESEVEEIQGGTNDMENPAISENSSLKISTNSADILSV